MAHEPRLRHGQEVTNQRQLPLRHKNNTKPTPRCSTLGCEATEKGWAAWHLSFILSIDRKDDTAVSRFQDQLYSWIWYHYVYTYRPELVALGSLSVTLIQPYICCLVLEWFVRGQAIVGQVDVPGMNARCYMHGWTYGIQIIHPNEHVRYLRTFP